MFDRRRRFLVLARKKVHIVPCQGTHATVASKLPHRFDNMIVGSPASYASIELKGTATILECRGASDWWAGVGSVRSQPESDPEPRQDSRR